MREIMAALRIGKVTVFTKPECEQCKMTVEQFEAHGLIPEVISLEEHPNLVKSLKDLGVTQPPFVEVEMIYRGTEKNKRLWYGYSADDIKEVIDIHNQTKQRAANPTTKPTALADKDKNMGVPF